METLPLSSPHGENFDVSVNSDRFYRLTTAEVIHFREAKFKPSVVATYCYIKTIDPFGRGVRILPKQIAKDLNYHHRTVSRAIKALVEAGELALAFIDAHVKLAATAVETVGEIVSKLGTKDIPTPAAPAPPQVDAALEPLSPPIPKPSTNQTKSYASVGNVIQNLNIPQPAPSSPDSDSKTPEWFAQIERRLNAIDIQLSDVLHALKKYPVAAIEASIAYTQKQTWSNAKAGVLVNYLKKWKPERAADNPVKSAVEKVTSALMRRFPESAGVLSLEQNPIDDATLDYLERLRVEGQIHGTHYNTVENYFGVFITAKDYPYSIPWWEALKILQRVYPACA